MNIHHQIGLGLMADPDDLARGRAERKAEARARKERGATRRPRIQVTKSSVERLQEIESRKLVLAQYEACFNASKKILIKLVEDGQFDESLDILKRHRRTVSHLQWRIHSAERAYKKAIKREGK